MWWMIAIVALVILGQCFIIDPKDDKPISQFKAIVILVLSWVLWLSTMIIVMTNSYFITPIIKDYEKGTIVKVETITVQGADTKKIVEYKYR